MADIVDSKTRSRMMSRIPGRDTAPELVLRRSLHQMGFRYRVHVRDLPGKPDMVFPKHRALVFVHGCFWHRHGGCKFATTPSSNVTFWKQKFEGTIVRDARILEQLLVLGWRIAVVWECELTTKNVSPVAKMVGRWLKSKKCRLELPAELAT